MKRMDRLVEAREFQREAASEKLARAQQQLDRLQATEEELLEQGRDRVLEEELLTAATLELMDTARRCARDAAEIG